MSFRCIWVLSLSKDDYGSVLLFRRFPTVEKRCETLRAGDYCSIPASSDFSSKLLVKLGLSKHSKEFVGWRDGAGRAMQLPIIELCVGRKPLWPIVTLAQNSFLVCCLPFIENHEDVGKDNLLKIPAVSVGFSLCLGVINFLGFPLNADAKLTKLAELETYLTLSMPFGTPSETDIACAANINRIPSQKFLKKQPAWKLLDYRGKQQIHIKITECVRCVLGPSDCVLDTFGQVSVKAELEASDVNISMLPSDVAHLDSLVFHPCVSIHGGPVSMGSGLPRRIRFTPPLHEFVLFQFCSHVPSQPPVQGVFKMRGENAVELFVQLKLSEKMKNSFDYCDLIIVFFNRGKVKNFESNASHGSPKLLEDKYTLKWSLGSKFPKDLEAVLTAKLEFSDSSPLPNSDPFCVDKNCYAQINFKQSNSTLSGCNVDPKNITVTEGVKPKITIEKSVQSAEYRLWNNYGDVPYPTQIFKKMEKVFT